MWYGLSNISGLKQNGLDVIKKNDEEIDKDFIKEEFWLLKGMSDINNRAGARKEKGLTRKEHEQGFIVGMQKQ